MSEINTQAIIDGMTSALREAYPESFIEAKNVEQGLKRPAFIVRALASGESDLPSNRLSRYSRFVVHYFPEGHNGDCSEIGDALCRILKVITLPSGDKLRGTEISFEYVDGVLHFYVTYKYNALIERDTPKMESLIVEQQGGNQNG